MNEINFMGLLIRDSNIVHDSAKERYRKPLGAVAAGTEITIGLSIHELRCTDVTLTVLHGALLEQHEMRPGKDMHTVSFLAPEEAVVLCYWFHVTLYDGSRVYYGAASHDNSGIGKIFLNEPPCFQITVYDRSFHTPDWSKEAVMYQIFPDRFACGNRQGVLEGLEYHQRLGRDLYLHDRWEEAADYLPSPTTGHYRPVDLFGGDLEGIRQRLPYLKELGVSLLYLNPIFEAASNHRYNTADYLRIDPVLGTEADFTRLTEEARALGIRVILDGVFSHTGDDSIYFDRYGRYEGLGAYESQDSPFYSWYHFTHFPNQYNSWWGFDTLPEVDEYQQDWIDFVIEKKDSVLNSWLDRGAAGFRLDVADELPDETIEGMRKALKANNQDSFLLGEVWEDATTKQSYNKNRLYALGRGLDSVMNYPFAGATIAFLRGHMNAYAYRRFLVSQSQNYPREMYYALMNLLSSHDVMRIRTALSRDVDPAHLSREDQAAYTVSEEEDRRGGALQRIAVAIQFALPGIPAVYYGDEVGMTGMLDPFNRQPYQVRDAGLAELYKKLSALRNGSRVLQTGHAVFYSTNGNVFGILRFILNGKDTFGNPGTDDFILMVCNPADISHRIVIDLHAEKECLTQAQVDAFREIAWSRAISLNGADNLDISGGLLEISLPPLSAEYYRLTWTS